jgi:uncharacterized membrane protein YgcG
MSSLEAVVRELRWSAARTSAVDYLLHAAVAAAVWVLAVFLAARLVPIEDAVRIAVFGVPIAFLAVAVAWMAARPRPMKLMRTADLRLGLKERLATAWERRYEKGPLDEALQRDALGHATRVRLTAAFPLRLRKREALLLAVAAIGSLGLALLPNSMNQVIAQRHADRVSQSHAAGTIAATKKQLAASPAPVDLQVQKILQDTQAKIANAPDPRTALQNITPAEQQLLQLSDPQTPARITSAQNLANALSTTNPGRNAGQAISTSPAKGAQSLRALASQLQSLSPQDRAALAKALANAAQHAQDPAMAASLQKASNALASGDLSGAAIALNDVATQLDSLQQQVSNNQEIATAVSSLEAARQQLASQADADAGVTAASPASGASPGSGAGSAPGTGGTPGTGTGSGAGSGSSGSGGTGGAGASGSGSGAGSGAKPTEGLYVPGQPVPGQSENDPTPLGPGQNVPLTPYTQVVQAYQQAALDAASQSLIPGSERDLIREYFSSLGEQQAGQ